MGHRIVCQNCASDNLRQKGASGKYLAAIYIFWALGQKNIFLGQMNGANGYEG